LRKKDIDFKLVRDNKIVDPS